jgi:hypothetical protein
MIWSHLHGDMQGVASKGVLFHLGIVPRQESSEIPCRVIELPEPGVILVTNRLITGKPSSYATRQGRRNSERVIPWEVARLSLVDRRVDPVTTDRPNRTCPSKT